MKKIWAGVLGLFLVVSGDAYAAAKQAGSASILAGRVMLLREGKWRQVWANDPIFVGDRIKTYADGRITLLFTDKSKIALAPRSELEVTTFLYDSGANSRTGLFKLWAGRFKATVSKVASKGVSVKFQTPTAVAGVRGTIVAVEIVPANTANPPSVSPEQMPEAYNTNVAVIEGLVGVSTLTPGGTGGGMGSGSGTSGSARSSSTSEDSGDGDSGGGEGSETLVSGGQIATVAGDGSGVSAARDMTPAESASNEQASNQDSSGESSESTALVDQGTNPEADAETTVVQSTPAQQLVDSTTEAVAGTPVSSGVPPINEQPGDHTVSPTPVKVKMGVHRVD